MNPTAVVRPRLVRRMFVFEKLLVAYIEMPGKCCLKPFLIKTLLKAISNILIVSDIKNCKNRDRKTWGPQATQFHSFVTGNLFKLLVSRTWSHKNLVECSDSCLVSCSCSAMNMLQPSTPCTGADR